MPVALRRALSVVLAAGLAFAVLMAVSARVSEDEPPRLSPGAGVVQGERGDVVDPLAWDPDRESDQVAAAERGFAHPLYTLVPGGAVATAERVARYRALIDTVTDGTDVDPDDLEALVYLESAGRPEVAADPQLEGAVGLTQILAQTGRDLLKMRVDERAARSLGRRIRRAERRGQTARAAALRAERRVVDERFDPEKALRGAVRYLEFAERELGRTDLALASFRAGVGNIQNVVAAYDGGDDVSYARLYFDSSPLHNSEAYDTLDELGDDSATYLWRLGAARDIMRMAREDPQALTRLAAEQTAKNSAEEVLWPEQSTQLYRSGQQLRDDYDDGTLRRLSAELLGAGGVRIDRQMGELAPRLGESRRLYRGLRPEALAVLLTIGTGVRDISRTAPMIATSTVRDARYQRLLTGVNSQATREYSLHTTGYAFDLLRRYRSDRQRRAFVFMLRRLQALDMIAWLTEPAAIHITVGPRATELLGILDTETERLTDGG